MNIRVIILAGLAAFFISSLNSFEARADYDQRFSLGLGVVQFQGSSQTDFEVGAEYEYRLEPLLGVGAFGSYIFSSPGITFIGAPEFFLHPFSTEFLVSASPVIEFGQGTDVGIRLGTRVPIDLGAITLVPSFAIDLISGGPDFIYGIGIEF